MRFQDLYKELFSLDDYRPSARVNFLFQELVRYATSEKKIKRFPPREKRRLWDICSKAEFLLEAHWAKLIVSGNVRLEAFPYFENYSDLTRLERHTLHGCAVHKGHSVLFVGGGPLPLTSIILAREYGVGSTILEIDDEACKLSTALIRKIGLSNMISVVNANAAHYQGYGKYTVIFVAALAGLTSRCKHSIFRQIKNFSPPKCHIVARTTWGNRKVLYKPLSPRTYHMFKPIIQINPYNGVVNSVLILRK